jgi:hypothetical protein
VTDFPELQQALVDAARRRHAPRRRMWRVVRMALPVAATAAAVAAIVVLAGDGPSDERPATPPPTLEPNDVLSRNYAVFRQPPTSADELPDGKSFVPLNDRATEIDPDRARLLFERGDSRIYAVAASRTERAGERPGVCVLEFVGEAYERGSCTDIGDDPALGGRVLYLPFLVDGRAAIAALAADDIRELELEFPGGMRERHPFSDSALILPADPWPSGLQWRNAAGGSVSVELTPEERPMG